MTMIKQSFTTGVFAIAMMGASSAYSSELNDVNKNLSAFQNIETSKVSVLESNNVSGQFISNLAAWERWFKTDPQAATAALASGFRNMTENWSKAMGGGKRFKFK